MSNLATGGTPLGRATRGPRAHETAAVEPRLADRFAVTLSIGILTSMFTAIIGTRVVINLIYGGRRVTRLSI